MRIELEYDEQLLANALESDATGAFLHLDQTLFLASIAVSMKRIADMLGSVMAEEEFPPLEAAAPSATPKPKCPRDCTCDDCIPF